MTEVQSVPRDSSQFYVITWNITERIYIDGQIWSHAGISRVLCSVETKFERLVIFMIAIFNGFTSICNVTWTNKRKSVRRLNIFASRQAHNYIGLMNTRINTEEKFTMFCGRSVPMNLWQQKMLCTELISTEGESKRRRQPKSSIVVKFQCLLAYNFRGRAPLPTPTTADI